MTAKRSASAWFHLISVILMGAGVLVATGDGFAQSYAGLYHWAIEHGLHGWKAKSFPLMIDLFIGVGELGLFALALEGHKLTKRPSMAWVDLALPGGICAGGWGVSLAFNVGSVDHNLPDQLTAAVPPVASMLGLVVLLRTLHRLVGRLNRTEPVAAVTVEPVPTEASPALEAGQVFNRPQLGPVDDGEAGQPTFITLDDAVMSARAAGLSQEATAEVFHITKYRVQQIEKQRKAATGSDASDAPGDEVAA